MESSQDNLKLELERALNRQDLRHADLAIMLHTRSSSVSNWLGETNRPIPVDRIFQITRVIGDFRFACVAFEFFTGFKLISESGYADDPLAQHVFADKEERERMALEDSYKLAISKRKDSRTKEDLEVITSWKKERIEELRAEFSEFAILEQKII